MRTSKSFTFAIIISMGAVSSAWSDGNQGHRDGLRPGKIDGRSFLIQGEYLYIVPGFGLNAGDTLENCYTFNADTVPDDGLNSGVWDDPLFPAPGAAIPGSWVEHRRGYYTAVAIGPDGLTLSQNGVVIKRRGKNRLKAYSTVHVPGPFVLAEVLSVGHEVDECPPAP